MDIFDVGNPNTTAEGIVNDAFDEIDKLDKTEATKVIKEPEPVIEHVESEMVRKTSLDVCEVESDNIQPNDLRELVEPIQEMLNDESDMIEKIDSQIVENVDEQKEINPKNAEDPFDTSAFDSDAFDAFESRFEAADTLNDRKTISDDPFASPYKTSKSNDNEKNVFDTFEPFIPKQPENTPFKAKPKKKDSFEDSDFDDDSEEENIRIVIRAKMKDTSQTDTGVATIGKFCII